MKETEGIVGIFETVKHCGWILPYKNICFVADRPQKIQFNQEKVLHCEDGPAIAYRDGFEVYAWRGTRIPKEWITQGPKPEDAISWENVEQRRCAAEILGWDKVLKELNPKVLDKDVNPQIGELLEVDLPDIGSEKFIKVECGTGRTFAIPVPPEMTTALQANAWVQGITTEQLTKLRVRT